MGEQETFNFSIGLPTIDVALFHAFYRTSIKGRKDIIKVMFSDEGDDAIQKIDSSYTSRVAEIFAVLLKSIGIEIEFVSDDDKVLSLDDTELSEHVTDDGKKLFCTDYQFFLINRVLDIKEKILEKNPVITEEVLLKLIDEVMRRADMITAPLEKEIDELDLKAIIG